jgi:3-keto-5-aminohexanoate cleavage enzyme
MTEPFIVMCAPNGARRSHDDHSGLPISPDELADCADAILDAGASMMHVHVRDDAGGHSLDAGRYREATAAIRDRVGDRLVIQVTTEACGIYSTAEQMQLVRDLRPEAVSVALRELCPDDQAEAEAATFYRWMGDNNVMPQHILYSGEDVRRFEALRTRGVIPGDTPFVLFVLGRYAENLTGDVAELGAFIDALSESTRWAVCCFGVTEHEAVVAAAGMGGHARVGFENNLVMPDGRVADGNDDLVHIAAQAGLDAGRPVASADDVRAMFG